MTKCRATALALTAVLATGCATGRERMRANVEVVRKEAKPEILVARGDAYAAVGDFMRAAEYFAAAKAAGGDEALIVRRFFRACVADRQFRAALEYARDYLQRHPADQDVRLAHAVVSAAVGDAEESRSDFRQLLSAIPNNADIHFNFGILLRDRLGETQLAREQFASYLRLAPQGALAEEARAALETHE